MTSSYFLVAVGGALGSVLRYFCGQVVPFPFGNLAVNVVGSFAIGFAYVALAERSLSYPFLVAGLLGGFTTFSAFSLDALRLFEDGDHGMAVGYVMGSISLSLFACMIGTSLGRFSS